MNHEPKYKLLYCGKRKGKKRYRLKFWIDNQGFMVDMGTGKPRKKKAVKYYIKMLKYAFENMVGTTNIIDDTGLLHPLTCNVTLTECCEVGPITRENYCPNCGRKIIKPKVNGN